MRIGGPRPVSEQGHERRFRPHSAMSALAPITTKPTTLHNGREGPIATEVRCSKTATYSITSSARAKIDCGTLIPSALAVLRLSASTYLVGACTGRSVSYTHLRAHETVLDIVCRL